MAQDLTVSSLLQWAQRGIEEIDHYLRERPPPAYTDLNDARVTKARCVMGMSAFADAEARCTPGADPYAQAMLRFFHRPTATVVSTINQRTNITYFADGATYTLRCRDEACTVEKTTYVAAPRILAAGCGYSGPRRPIAVTADVAAFADVSPDALSQPMSALVFCPAYEGHDGISCPIDCRIHSTLKNTITTCFTLHAVYDAADDDVPLETAALVQFLTSQAQGDSAAFDFSTNRIWPDPQFEETRQLAYFGNGFWTGANVIVKADVPSQSIQILIKPENHMCEALYEAPCTAAQLTAICE